MQILWSREAGCFEHSRVANCLRAVDRVTIDHEVDSGVDLIDREDRHVGTLDPSHHCYAA
jgi:hypothetical protein